MMCVNSFSKFACPISQLSTSVEIFTIVIYTSPITYLKIVSSVLLRYNQHTSLCKFEVYSMII